MKKVKHTITITFETEPGVNPNADLFKEVALDAFVQLESLYDDYEIDYHNAEWEHAHEEVA